MKADLMKAIRFMCAECMGFEDITNGIKGCTAPACPLFPFRLSKDPSPHDRMPAYQIDAFEWAGKRKTQERDAWTGEKGFIAQ